MTKDRQPRIDNLLWKMSSQDNGMLASLYENEIDGLGLLQFFALRDDRVACETLDAVLQTINDEELETVEEVKELLRVAILAKT